MSGIPGGFHELNSRVPDAFTLGFKLFFYILCKFLKGYIVEKVLFSKENQ